MLPTTFTKDSSPCPSYHQPDRLQPPSKTTPDFTNHHHHLEPHRTLRHYSTPHHRSASQTPPSSPDPHHPPPPDHPPVRPHPHSNNAHHRSTPLPLSAVGDHPPPPRSTCVFPDPDPNSKPSTGRTTCVNTALPSTASALPRSSINTAVRATSHRPIFSSSPPTSRVADCSSSVRRPVRPTTTSDVESRLQLERRPEQRHRASPNPLSVSIRLSLLSYHIILPPTPFFLFLYSSQRN